MEHLFTDYSIPISKLCKGFLMLPIKKGAVIVNIQKSKSGSLNIENMLLV